MVLILFAAAGVFRFWMLGHTPFTADTMDFYRLALRNQSIVDFWKNPPWMNQMPLNETFALLLIKAGLPATPFVVRLPFAAMGVLTLFFVWRFAVRRFGTGAALLTLILAVFNPYQIYYSRTAYHYSGAICWSAALFLAFWSIKETVEKNKTPGKKQMALWFLAAAVTCHMHMSVWIVVGLQALLLLIFGLRLKGSFRNIFLMRFLIGGVLLGILMLRWILRAVHEILNFHGAGGTGNLALPSAGPEFLRLLPAYFAGENIFAVAWLLIFIALAVFALFGTSETARRFRSLAWICALHIAGVMLYLAVVGGGLAKITYFSGVWSHFILLTAVGAYLGVQRLVAGSWRAGLYVLLLAGGYIALTAWPDRAIVRLEGTPTPFYKINDWVLKNLPEGTPILTDRWLEPWNELAIHNPGNINYTFTVPDEPVETYRQLNWRKTAEQFFEKYPEAAFLELNRGKYEAKFGEWAFPQSYFAHYASITNGPALVLHRWKVLDFADANTNRVITRIYYNTPEDLVVAARRDGRDVLRLYGAGWGYAKPGWQQGHFEDYRILGQSASIDLYNLKETALSGSIEISAATAERPKTISVAGTTTVFAPGRIRTWTVPLTLQPGKNTIPFSSLSGDSLFVLDIRWKPVLP